MFLMARKIKYEFLLMFYSLEQWEWRWSSLEREPMRSLAVISTSTRLQVQRLFMMKQYSFSSPTIWRLGIKAGLVALLWLLASQQGTGIMGSGRSCSLLRKILPRCSNDHWSRWEARIYDTWWIEPLVLHSSWWQTYWEIHSEKSIWSRGRSLFAKFNLMETKGAVQWWRRLQLDRFTERFGGDRSNRPTNENSSSSIPHQHAKD